MSNETDLDWLARNVHVWPTNTPKAILPGDATFKLGAVFYGDCVAFSGELEPEYRRVNKADWLARRAELQGASEHFKPSIEEANRLAKEFSPFISIEDNQDREGVNQKLNELEMLGKVSHLISDKRHRITPSKYTKAIRGVSVDVYDVLMAWGVTNPALQHLIKKALQCGQRGHKDNEQDLQDIIDSAIRAKELG